MATTTLSTTNNTPKVRDGLKKDGTVLITKRGYIMWLKKQHDEHQWNYIFTISRYSAAECPLGRYCAEMGTSIWKAPKWAQKVREYYAGKDHGLVYTAIDAKGHMTNLFGYKCSDIFYGEEEDSSSSNRKAPKAKQASVHVAPAVPVVEAAKSEELDANTDQHRVNDFVELSNGVAVHRYNIIGTSFVKHTVYERYNGHSSLTYTKLFGKLGDITTRPIGEDIKALRLGSVERHEAVDKHYASLKALKEQYVRQAFSKDFE